uniref:PHD-type domain-containing protein n=1 Tax=Denticeps clupeoides TaxID=299321 RepID=A0AAY4EC93_9TELE
MESPERRGAPVRRSGRQAKRTDKLEEFLLTTKRGRGGGRRSAPAFMDCGDAVSQNPTDAETASEASFDGNAEAKNKATSPERKTRGGGRKKTAAPAKPGAGGSVSDDGSSENEEEEEEEEEEEATVASGETQKISEEQPEATDYTVEEQVKEGKDKPVVEAATRRPARSPARGNKDTKKDARPKSGLKSRKAEDEDEDYEESESESSDSDDEGYDPNALYCICRQKHNKRFMICCDRCEEWFHGDCVGITEARGRLMERNGEDYICPKCNGQKGQVTRPTATSTTPSENGKRSAPVTRKSEPSPAVTVPTASSAEVEDKTSEDLGIKGRIEKATNPSGKKKIKIFQPAVGASSLPKCIGPGCDRNALPDSVYCGNDCILRHAAAAMKSITDVKEPIQKDKSKPKGMKKTTGSSLQVFSGRLGSPVKAEEDGESESEPDEDDEDEHAEEHPPPPAMSSWSSDHNYNAVTPEKTAPIAPSVLNKTCMYLFEGLPHLKTFLYSY